MLRIATTDTQSQPPGPGRATVLYGTAFDGWDLPPLQGNSDRQWIHGGERALIELAAGLASLGLAVDIRGEIPEREIAKIEQAVGVRIGRPETRRLPTAEDLIVMPEGHVDPLLFARMAYSPARAVLLVQGALGMFGWSFDGGPSPEQEELDVLDISTVGRPEQLVAARRFGFELWSNVAAIAKQGQDLGLPMHYVGSGRPLPYPEPPAKQVDVLVLGNNRWGSLARQVLSELPEGVTSLVLPQVSQAEVLAAMGIARVLIHPSRFEGRSRIVEEARAMRTVPLVLASNTLGEGYGEQFGSVVVDHVAQMAPAIVELLADPERLDRLAENGHRTAREVGAWPAYQERLRAALDNPDREVAEGAPWRAQLGRRFHDVVRLLAIQMAEAERKISAAAAQIQREQQALALERAALERQRAGF